MTKKVLSNGKSCEFVSVDADEEFVVFLISKFVTCVIDGFTMGMGSRAIVLFFIKGE
jgi:hypothetical protein